MKQLKIKVTRLTFVALCCMLVTSSLLYEARHYISVARASSSHKFLDCKARDITCIEQNTSEGYSKQNVSVGYDEPSVLFYSHHIGSGNHMSYMLTLPKDPPLSSHKPGASFNFQLYSTFWFGMAMCDTQSYPEQLSTCTPDSDTNIVDPAVSFQHSGTAFMELQFYPPGWVQRPAGISCDARKWCAALTIDSLSKDPITGQSNNLTCQSIAGLEYVNFAFITKNGTPRFGGPPNPIQSNVFTFTPDPSLDLFMNSGDHILVKMHDTVHGVAVFLKDETTGQSGSMTASAANGFGQVQFDPTGTSCNYIPYDFHPMYSTSSEKTRVPWATHSYNIAFADEIGHFDYCNVVKSTGACADNQDTNCFPSSASLLVHVSGCIETNTNFEGASYRPIWPDGNNMLHPTSVLFTSPLTGNNYNVSYSRFAFETNLPLLESENGQCNLNTGYSCKLIPETKNSHFTDFYPFFSTRRMNGRSFWQLGNHIPGSKDDFNKNWQYGTLLKLTYAGLGGSVIAQYNDFRQIFEQ